MNREDNKDKKEVSRIRRRMQSQTGYSDMVGGVHTWDVAAIFEDMRTLLRIATRRSSLTLDQVKQEKESK